ncbi:MAG: phenylalanine--tRNA ligase subunit alpha, partial [Treponema sp.]|nr:phenylalanine--tRNA ligase subunit alpha [Treponema sp.]
MASNEQGKTASPGAVAKNLHPLEIRILLSYRDGDELTIERVERELAFKPGNGNQALSWLAGKGLVAELRRETAVFYELTGLGEEWKEKGSPQERLIQLIRLRLARTETLPGLSEVADLLKLENKDIGSAFGNLSKLGVLGMDENKRLTITLPIEDLEDPEKNPVAAHFALMRGLLHKVVTSEDGLLPEASLTDDEKQIIAGMAKKRGAADSPFRIVERQTVVFGFVRSDDGCPAEALAGLLRTQGITGEELGPLTQEMLETGSWRGKAFRAYNVNTPPTRLIPGRSNPYAQFLEGVKDKLVSLGFQEFDGPLVQTEFWNCDALFMPQFHSARDIHDSYSIA